MLKCGHTNYLVMTACRFASAAPEDDLVYGACGPGWDRTAGGTIPEWIEFMQDRGIERVCCLLSERQVAGYDSLLPQYRSAFGTEKVAHVPVTDHTLMDETTLTEQVLPVLEAAVDNAEPLVVHCKAGIGRTGQVLAGWLVYAHDYASADAISTVTERHRRPDDAVRAGNATEADLHSLLATVA